MEEEEEEAVVVVFTLEERGSRVEVPQHRREQRKGAEYSRLLRQVAAVVSNSWQGARGKANPL